MDYRNLSDADLVDFAKNVEAKLAGHKIECFDNALAEELAAELAPLNTAFETTIEDAVVIETSKTSVFQNKRNQRAETLERLGVVLSYLKSTKGDKKYYDECGFNYPKSAGTVVPNDPTNLAAVGASNGVNKLRFEGNNKSGTVIYQIYRRHGDTADWYSLDMTRRQTYTDTPVTPGQYYEYKVRAVAARSKSNWSNTAVVYGAP